MSTETCLLLLGGLAAACGVAATWLLFILASDLRRALRRMDSLLLRGDGALRQAGAAAGTAQRLLDRADQIAGRAQRVVDRACGLAEEAIERAVQLKERASALWTRAIGNGASRNRHRSGHGKSLSVK